jgi:orotate phosphoribosyltransferase
MPEATLDDLRKEFSELLQAHCFSFGDFVLASGRRSNFFYNGKLVTLSPRGAFLTGRLVFEALRGHGIEAVGGKTLGADPIATAVALVSDQQGEPIPAYIVRATQKDHGKKDLVAEAFGPGDAPLLAPGRRVAVVDDVATTGGSCFEAIQEVEARGCTVAMVVTLVDRQEGAAENFAARGYRFRPLYLADAQGRLSVAPPVG